MRTTLDLPEDLIEDVQRELGFKSKTDVIIYSLREVLRRKRLEGLKQLAGKIDLTIDINNSRRRPSQKRKSI